jgi:hypothetical protein
MGMNCTLYRASAAEIEGLIDDPPSLGAFLERIEGPAPEVREVRPKGILGFLLRLTPVTITEVVPLKDGEPDFVPDPDRTVDITKGWHGLHFLFTGTSDEGDEPACYMVRGGEDLDDEGNARALRPDQVRRFAEYLSALTREELERRYDPARMKKLEIYPDAVWTRPESSARWLLDCFSGVRSIIGKAAEAGDGVVIHIS